MKRLKKLKTNGDMNSVSVYTSLFNYSPEKFDLIETFDNWSKYANEIVIATFKGGERELYRAVAESTRRSSLALSKL